MLTLAELTTMLQAVCPILGVNTDGVIWFAPSATQAQKDAATALMTQNLKNIKPPF